jgi:epoxyqueuosine reductase
LFQPHDNLLTLSKKEWSNLSDEYFQALFKKSAVKRTKKSGLMRNISFVQEDKN